MNTIKLIKLITKLVDEHNKKIFKLNEISVLSGESGASVGMALIRAQKKGIVARVKNIWFGMLNKPTLEEVALYLRPVSYISFESALYKHGILSQSPRGALTLATTSRPEIVKTPLGNIQFVHLAKKFFFGFDENRMAYPEKAILDMLYIRGRKGRFAKDSETLYFDLLDKKKLAKFSKPFPNNIKSEAKKLIS